MKDPCQYPKLRQPIEVRLEKINEQPVIVISCPLGIAPSALLVAPAAAPLLSAMQGELSIDEITARYARLGVQREKVAGLVRLLDEHFFLATPRFEQAQQKAQEEFNNALIRPAALAGTGYPDSPKMLRQQITEYIEQANGVPVKEQDASAQGRDSRLLALVAPHIDYRRGSRCYGLTYSRLKNQQHELFILIGTGHQYSQKLFHLTAKDFTTPLGLMRCDVPFVSKLAELYGAERSFADQFLHRREHSLELQLPFLQVVNPQASIVPILAGSFHNILRSQKTPQQCEEYETFARSLTECTRERWEKGCRICFVAAVDMAHIGQVFGDQIKLSAQQIKEVAESDQAFLEAVLNVDPEAVFKHVASDGDARRLCGFPAIFTVLDVLRRLGFEYCSKVFDYSQAVDYQSDCAVTFAGLGIYTSGPRP